MWRRSKREPAKTEGSAVHASEPHASEPHASEPTAPEPEPDNEFDAFLAGRYSSWCVAHHVAVPAWAWVNAVAHASLDELHALATRVQVGTEADELVVWEHLVRFMAREVVATVHDDEALLREVQRQALVPFELAMAHDWWRTVTPIDVATRVIVVLQDAARPR